jgi:hypothetical protein
VRLPGDQELSEVAWLRCLTQGTAEYVESRS